MLQKIYDSLLTLAYPQVCHNCQESVEASHDGIACRKCWESSRIFSGNETLCAKCAAFLQEKPSNFQALCHQCDEHFYDAACAVGLYEKALAASVLNLKREPFIAGRLKKLFIKAVDNVLFNEISV